MKNKSPFAGKNSQLDNIPKGMPIVFISYSWDDEPHKEWVSRLSKDLREKYRVYTLLDQYNRGGEDIITFMRKGLDKADRVLIIGTPKYIEKIEKTKNGGVKFEDQVITISLYNEMETSKFIPILREGSFFESFNQIVATRVGYDMSDDGKYEEELYKLAADLWGQPMNSAPILGPKPNFTPPSIVLQQEIPESPQDFATLVKKYLLDSSKRIILDEMLEKETDKAYKKIIQHAHYDKPISTEIFNTYNEIHQEAISNLIQVIVPMVRYGTIEQIQILVDAMVKLCKKTFVNGEIANPISSNMHLFASSYLFHTMGVACIKYERFDIVNLLVSSKVHYPTVFGLNHSFSLHYLAGCNHWDAFILNQLMNSNWIFPYSSMIMNGIWPVLENIFFDETDFRDTFYTWEHMSSLLFRYHKNNHIKDDWNPIGGFLHKRISILRQMRDSYTVFFRSAEELKDEWSPIKQGLFGGSYTNYRKIYEESEEYYKKQS